MPKLNRNDLHHALGLKIERDFTNNHRVPGGWQYTDDAVIKLWHLREQIGSQELLDYLNGRIDGARRRAEESKVRQAVKEAATKAAEDARKKEEADRQAQQSAKLDAELTGILKAAGATDTDVERLLPELRAKTLLERAGKIAKKFERESMSTF